MQVLPANTDAAQSNGGPKSTGAHPTSSVTQRFKPSNMGKLK